MVAALRGSHRRRGRAVTVHYATPARAELRMSFHPNDVARRARMSSLALVVGFLLLIGAFFKTQVIQNRQYVMQSEENRLRPIPLPAPRGVIYDRHGQVIAENLPAYSVSITAPTVDSLHVALSQLASTLQLTGND